MAFRPQNIRLRMPCFSALRSFVLESTPLTGDTVGTLHVAQKLQRQACLTILVDGISDPDQLDSGSLQRSVPHGLPGRYEGEERLRNDTLANPPTHPLSIICMQA